MAEDTAGEMPGDAAVPATPAGGADPWALPASKAPAAGVPVKRRSGPARRGSAPVRPDSAAAQRRPVQRKPVRTRPVRTRRPRPASAVRPIEELRALAIAARDGVVAVASALLVALVGLLIVVYVSMSNVTLGFKDIYSAAAILTGTGFGVPDRASLTGSMSQFLSANGDTAGASAVGGMTFSVTVDLRITVWLLPFLAMTIAYLLNRRAERKRASAEPWRALLRALASGLAGSLGVLVIALTSHNSQEGVLPSAIGKTVPDTGALDSVLPITSGGSGLVIAFVFVGPLLLVFLASLLGRAGVWLRTPGPDRRIERVRTGLALWAPATRTVWLQARIIGVLTGLVLWIRLFIEIADDHSTVSHHLGAVAIAGALLFLNLSVYGAFIGFGVTVTAAGGAAYSGAMSSAASSGSLASTSGGSSALAVLKGSSTGIGLFSEHGEWVVWLLFIAVVLGTLAPVLLSLRGRRFAVRAEDYPLRGCWRPVVLGALGALVLLVAGRLSAGLGADLGAIGGMNISGSVGPEFFAALGLTALWFLLGYLAISFTASSPEQDDEGAEVDGAVEDVAEGDGAAVGVGVAVGEAGADGAGAADPGEVTWLAVDPREV